MRPNMKPDEFLTLAIQTALAAGAMLEKKFGTVLEISSKEGNHNLVTECDKAAEEMIITTIHKKFPGHAILAEESGASTHRNDITWVIDPLDGTVNFAHGVPVFAVSIGVAIEETLSCGVVYQPITKELFFAQKGQGSFLNGKALQVTQTAQLTQAFLATGFPYNVNEDPLNCIEVFAKLTRLGLPIRRLGSAALDLSYVAAGRFDAYWEASLYPWDFAAGKLIVEEAGGKVTNYQDQPLAWNARTPILSSNGHLHPQLREVVCP